MLIMITGLKRSGKDTVGDYLSSNWAYDQYAFANPIKEACAAIFGWNGFRMNGETKDDVDPIWGISPRRALQLMGTELFQYELPRLDPEFARVTAREIWVKSTAMRIDSEIKFRQSRGLADDPDDIDFVITDWRFPHEYEYMSLHYPGTLVTLRVDRGLPTDDLHESEVHIPTMPVDYEIKNDSSIVDLQLKVHAVLQELINKRVY